MPFRYGTFVGVTPAGFYYEAFNFCAAEHGGTHLDAPVHFAKGKCTADQIPLGNLTGEAV
ncbi:MAG: cyclase family protein [Chitinophagaceae bacterium]|nr:cyclase family protein [Chitinophagaceae bacterium]